LIREAKRLDPAVLIVIMTAFASFENAVNVMREGAFDYLPKPFNSEQLSHCLKKIRTIIDLRRENETLKKSRGRRDFFAGFTSPASQRLEEFVRKVAPSEATILLEGESGTGKSELAILIHELSSRTSHPFVTVNCTTLAETLMESELFGHMKGAFTGATQDKPGKLELADGGTLFLDEIGDLSLASQAKLLRFLQDRVFERVGSNEEVTVDARVIAATNKDLEQAVQGGKFREDLYYRLNMLETKLVSLRFRKEDLPVLTQRILKELRSRYGEGTPDSLPPAIMARFAVYHWPGNIRELRNVIERIVMLSGGRGAREEDLPEAFFVAAALPAGSGFPTLEEVEREHIRKVLSQEKKLEKAAQVLGIGTATLWRKRKEYGLE
jgi:NtrC-family two-component system response regulator AlgB